MPSGVYSVVAVIDSMMIVSRFKQNNNQYDACSVQVAVFQMYEAWRRAAYSTSSFFNLELYFQPLTGGFCLDVCALCL